MEQLKKSMKDKVAVRWGILLLIASVQAANYYFYDAISPLKRLLEDNFNFTSGDFGLFVAAYSIPNTFLLMAVLGGVILDKLGIRRTGFLFVGFMAIGGLVTAYGASEYFSNGGFLFEFFNSFLTGYSPELKMMLLGRFLFGLGAETSIVVVSKVIVKWFKGKELALAFGMKIGIARAGSALALYYSPKIANMASHWSIAIWFAAIILLVGFLAFLVYTIFDLRIDKQTTPEKGAAQDDGFSFTDLKELLTNRSFIFVTLLCVTFYSAVFPFQAFSPDFLLNKFGMDLSKSGEIASILYWVTMFATPFFGFVVDRYGRSATLMIFGSIILALVHFTFALTYFSPIVPLVLLGIAIALVPAAMWPSVAKIVPEKRLGSAYGAMFSIQNFGLFLFPILVGLILDTTNKNAEIFLQADQVNEIKATKIFAANYLDNNNDPIQNKELLASVTLYTLPESILLKDNKKDLKSQVLKQGELIWSEDFKTHSNLEGNFSGMLGTSKIKRVNINYFNLKTKNLKIEIIADNEAKTKIAETELSSDFFDTEKPIYEILLAADMKKVVEEADKIKLRLIETTENLIILDEDFDVFFNSNGELQVKLGKGDINYANIDYLTFASNTVIRIKTPLNYTFAILLFAMLGILGIIFAILLKREDKNSGYGLELPSNVKAKNTK